jgi:urease accessory protein
MPMGSDPADRLRLVQWLSPAFPIGSFAYSQGLETAIADGRVTNADELTRWILAILCHGTGRLEGVALALARAPGADLPALSDLVLAHAASAERATETMEQGRAFAATISAITGRDLATMPYAVAVGVVTAPLQVTTEEVLLLWLNGLAAQLVSVAVRFVPLGQTAGQAVLAALAPDMITLAGELAGGGLDDMSSTTFGADLAAMAHETMETRIYRS